MELIFGGLFYLFLLSIGIGMVIVNIKALIKIRKNRRWKTVMGEITHVEIGDKIYNVNETPSTSESEIKLKYTFSINGNKYNISNLDIKKANIISTDNNKKGSIYRGDLLGIIDKIKKDPKVKVWVNPENPEYSIIVWNRAATITYMYFGFLIIMIIVISSVFLSGIIQVSRDEIEVITWKAKPKENFSSEE